MKIILKIVLVSVLLFTIFNHFSEDKMTDIKEINLNEINEIEDAVIIDVRSQEEYQEGYIVGSENIPLERISSLNIEKDTNIIVYCRSGNRSGQAADILKDLGYSNVIDAGGILGYEHLLIK